MAYGSVGYSILFEFDSVVLVVVLHDEACARSNSDKRVVE